MNIRAIIIFVLFFQYGFSQISISNVIEQVQSQADSLLTSGTAIISDDQIYQIQSEANAMLANNSVPQSTSVNPAELFIVFCSRSDRNGTRIPITEAGQNYTSTTFNPLVRTIIYVFGWTSGVDKPGTVAVRDGILNRVDVNVLILDWSKYTQTWNYFDAYRAVEDTGKYLGQFLAQLITNYPAYQITIVGHSLGAHLAGFGARCVGGVIPVIIALDPAGMLYCKYAPSKRLNTGDAQHVMVIHTSYLGIQFSFGHSDFWPNGGVYQKGCAEFMCSHIRAMYLYVDSLSDFIFGRKCEHFWMFALGLCNLNDQTKMAGSYVDITAKGDYDLWTNSKPPYGQNY